MPENLLIEISTKNRQRVLARCLAALLNQSFQKWDLLIIDDQPIKPLYDFPFLKVWLDILERNHEVHIIPGTQKSQAHNHNIPLWSDRFAEYKYVLRLDDDILLNRTAVEELMFAMSLDSEIAAVAGLYFENEKTGDWADRGDMPSVPRRRPQTNGSISDVPSNWQQRLYHSDGEIVYYVDHLYSACLYEVEAMRRVGGWPEVYSRGVAHGEETDGTYRLGLSGRALAVAPAATGQHLKSPGGVRSVGQDIGASQFMDNQRWMARRPMLAEVDFVGPIKVGVWGENVNDIGGAQRLFYHTLHLLQQKPSRFDVYPVFTGAHLSPDECREAFGFSYSDRELVGSEFDVMLTVSHYGANQPGKVKVGIVCYPDQPGHLDEYAKILAISEFTSSAIAKKWRVNAEVAYPPILPIASLEKKDWILFVTRLDPYKAPLWLAEVFDGMDWHDWELHIVGSTSSGVWAEYEEQLRKFVSSRPNIFLHENISQGRLAEFYGHAKILWAAKGMYGDVGNNPHLFEHFGYTPIEAASAGCVPIVFDGGGYKETVKDDARRWSTKEELIQLTKVVRGEWQTGVADPGVEVDTFGIDGYRRKIFKAIYQAHGRTVALEKPGRIEVTAGKPIVVGCLTDSPRLTSGFGTVAKQIYRGFCDAGFQVHALGIMDNRPLGSLASDDDLPVSVLYPCYPDDPLGQKHLPLHLANMKPDVLFVLYDPGGMRDLIRLAHLAGLGGRVPIIGYFPVESFPPTEGREALLDNLTVPVVYCQSARNLLADAFPKHADRIIVAPHGLDHAPFEPYASDLRERLRRLIGWEDKFIVVNVGVNKRTKGHPRMLEVAKELKRRGREDFVWYMHTRPNDPILQGYPLGWMARQMKVDDVVVWPPDQARHAYCGIGYGDFKASEAFLLTPPPTQEQRDALFGLYDYITRLNIAHLYVDLSEVEGWGLPLGEAMACGVPCITVDDASVRKEVYEQGAYFLSSHGRHTHWHTGAELVDVDPLVAADAIEMLWDDPDERAALASRGQACAAQYSWDAARNILVEQVRKVVNG